MYVSSHSFFSLDRTAYLRCREKSMFIQVSVFGFVFCIIQGSKFCNSSCDRKIDCLEDEKKNTFVLEISLVAVCQHVTAKAFPPQLYGYTFLRDIKTVIASSSSPSTLSNRHIINLQQVERTLSPSEGFFPPQIDPIVIYDHRFTFTYQ